MLTELRHTRWEARDPNRVERMISIVRHREGHALAAAVEEAKIALTDAEASAITFDGEETTLDIRVGRDQLTRALETAVGRIAQTIGTALAGAGLEASRLDTLILTGGSTRIPAIMTRLRHLFPAARFVETDAFGSVGLGLALDARRKFG